MKDKWYEKEIFGYVFIMIMIITSLIQTNMIFLKINATLLCVICGIAVYFLFRLGERINQLKRQLKECRGR